VAKFSGPLEHPEYRNQEREKDFEHLAPSLNKARKEPVFPLDGIDSHREHFRVSEVLSVCY
jgi:cohesin loading factor subunit SCC2